jgi:hypothetical protein
MTVTLRAAGVALCGLVLLLVAGMAPAGAQESTSSTEVKAPTKADVAIDLGDYDASIGDWTVSGLQVTGDMELDTEFTVKLTSNSGRELFSATVKYTGPGMRIPVDRGVAVRDVDNVAFSSNLLAGELITPELGENSLQGGGGSTGQVATSMALVMIVAVILFRTPLPAAATQRWTK